MYSEDPKNRKAPSILLGFIAITGALILALFLTGILKAHAETDLPYNYIAFVEITNSNVTFNDMSGEVLYSLPTFSGAPIPNQNFEAALNNLLAYIPASECLVFIVDNLATKAVYEYVLDSFTSRYVTVLEVNTTIFPFDLTGYEIGYYPAGMWNVPIFTKTVPLTPTVSPTPTPTPDLNSFLLSLGSTYLLVDVYGSGVASGSVTVPYDSSLQELQTEYNSNSDQAIYSAFISMPRSNYGPCIAIYFNYSSIDYINVYRLSSNPVDLDYVRNNSSPYSLTIQSISASDPSFTRQTMDNDYYYFCGYKSGYANSMYLGFEYKYSSSNSFSVVNLYDNFLDSGNIQSISEGLGLNYGFFNGSLYKTGLRYRINFEPVDNPFVTPAPPTPTEATHVIINWPSGTPTPTPPFYVPGNSGTGSGSSGSGSLSPGQIGSTLDTFKTYTENNNAFAFLYACTSVIPDEALYFLFILLFILLLLACIRLFVHFTG